MLLTHETDKRNGKKGKESLHSQMISATKASNNIQGIHQQTEYCNFLTHDSFSSRDSLWLYNSTPSTLEEGQVDQFGQQGDKRMWHNHILIFGKPGDVPVRSFIFADECHIFFNELLPKIIQPFPPALFHYFFHKIVEVLRLLQTNQGNGRKL